MILCRGKKGRRRKKGKPFGEGNLWGKEEQRRKRRKMFGEGKCYHGGTNNENKQGNIEYSANGLGKAEMSNFIRTEKIDIF